MSRYKKTINILDFERTAHVINFNIISFFFRQNSIPEFRQCSIISEKLGNLTEKQKTLTSSNYNVV